jgi:hypothetical protein
MPIILTVTEDIMHEYASYYQRSVNPINSSFGQQQKVSYMPPTVWIRKHYPECISGEESEDDDECGCVTHGNDECLKDVVCKKCKSCMAWQGYSEDQTICIDCNKGGESEEATCRGCTTEYIPDEDDSGYCTNKCYTNTCDKLEKAVSVRCDHCRRSVPYLTGYYNRVTESLDDMCVDCVSKNRVINYETDSE